MNPTIARDSKIISDAFDGDAAWAGAEYGAEFRTDVEAFLSREAIEACVDVGVFERPADLKRRYYGFVDPSGGSSDSMTLAIAHIEGSTVVLDLIREVRPPFSPEAVVQEFVATLKRYRLSTVMGDAYGAQWVQESFGKAGCYYHVSDRPKSALYLDFLPIANSLGVRLLDHPKMVNQFASLERQTRRGSRDSVDHPRGAHDDVANAVAGVVAWASKGTTGTKLEGLTKPKPLPPGVYAKPEGGWFAVLPGPDAPEQRDRWSR
jgi:hypothetical protein